MGGGGEDVISIGFNGVFLNTHMYRNCGPSLMIYTSYDVFPRKDEPFGGSVDKLSLRNFGASIDILKPNARNIQTFILSKLLHGIQPNFAHQ